MNPREYIAAVKGNFPTRHLNASELPELAKKKWQESGGSLDELLETINTKDFAEYLLDLLSPRLPDELIQLFRSGFIAVGAVEDPTPNAFVKRLDGEGYAIIFNIGLRDFIYRVARILATRFVPQVFLPRIPEKPPISFEESARLIAEVFWWLQETGRTFGPDYPIHEQQAMIANLLALEAETFLLAHEIGHVIDEGSRHQNAAFLKLGDTIPLHHREEHAADVIGLNLVMELHNNNAERHPFLTPLTYAGVEFALLIYQGLELLGFEVDESHPGAPNRIKHLRLEMESRCESEESWRNLSGLAFAIETIFSRMLAIIQDPGEHEEFFNREAERILLELDDLLESCIGSLFPNYMYFHMHAGEIFNRGYSHKLLERIASVAADFFSDVRQLQDGNPVANSQVWKRFQKYKLLLSHILEYTSEPARSIFLNTLEGPAKEYGLTDE